MGAGGCTGTQQTQTKAKGVISGGGHGIIMTNMRGGEMSDNEGCGDHMTPTDHVGVFWRREG